MREQAEKMVREEYGLIPNIYNHMLKSPATVMVYLQGAHAMRNAELSEKDQQIVQVAASGANECAYCIAAHGMLARQVGVAPADVDAIAHGGTPADDRARRLTDVTRAIMKKRGHLSDEEKTAAIEGGITEPQLVEILALIGLKTFSNYLYHLFDPEIDDFFLK